MDSLSLNVAVLLCIGESARGKQETESEDHGDFFFFGLLGRLRSQCDPNTERHRAMLWYVHKPRLPEPDGDEQ